MNAIDLRTLLEDCKDVRALEVVRSLGLSSFAWPCLCRSGKKKVMMGYSLQGRCYQLD